MYVQGEHLLSSSQYISLSTFLSTFYLRPKHASLLIFSLRPNFEGKSEEASSAFDTDARPAHTCFIPVARSRYLDAYLRCHGSQKCNSRSL